MTGGATTMGQDRPGGLWVPVPLLRHRATKRTVTLDSGERALVTVDDSGTVQHVETANRLDATVRPATVKLVVVRRR